MLGTRNPDTLIDMKFSHAAAVLMLGDGDGAKIAVKSRNGPTTEQQVDPYAHAACGNFRLTDPKFVKVECFRSGYCLWGYVRPGP